ncbi:MAG TPA: DUF4032 domain-containing protein, partial [Gaiellaceae bacterium]|nr:DUF4032 domain-containing protein [Gaiellaceae bacterium]
MATSPAFRLVARADQRAFLGLPWSLPLEEWPGEILVDADRGIGRHVVRFVAFGSSLYALKELPPRIATREYGLLTKLEDEGLPIVSAAGIVERPELESVLITRYLEFALPYRLILGRGTRGVPETAMRAALAELLVRLHLAGFFWGDCSLSNALFRRDAGALAAYAVDAETGELHERLSDGQRGHDLEIAEENLAGELFDLAAELERDIVDDPFAFAADVRARYDDLWSELTREEVFAPDDSAKLEERLRRLNELGYDVDEVELISSGDEVRLRLHSKVVEPDYHRRRLLHLTGLDAQENQARRLLNSITRHRARLESEG